MPQLRSMLAPGQRQPQRLEQCLALAPGSRLDRLDPVREARLEILRQTVRRDAQQLAVGDLGPQRAAAHLPPQAGLLELGEVAADGLPEVGVDPAQALLAEAG